MLSQNLNTKVKFNGSDSLLFVPVNTLPLAHYLATGASGSMSSPTFASDFRIIQRFPVLRGARATALKASPVLCEPDAAAAPAGTEPIESNHLKRHPPDFQRNVVSGGIMPRVPVSTAVHRSRSPSRQSFDGMPEKLVYGLFESHKNVRFVIPKNWSPTNPRQVR